MRTRRTTLRPLAAALALSLTIAACATGDGTADDDLAPEDDPVVGGEPGDGPGGGPDAADVELTLLTHDSFDASTEVLDAFTAETGIGLTVVELGDAGTALNQTILTEGEQGDLLFGVDTTFLSRALDAELFAPYESPLLASVPDRYVLDPEHRVTPIDVGDVCLNYDRAWFDEQDLEVPTDLADLTDPAYEGLLVVQNPATSSPGLSFLLATIDRFGEDGYLGFWEELVDNDVLVVDGWTEAYYSEFTAASDGDRPLVVSYASSPPAEVFFAEEELDEAPTGVIEASCFRQIEFVGILAASPQQDAAAQLVDFLLSPTFQEDIPLTMFVFPVNEEAELPEVFVEHAVLPEDPLELDPAVIGENRDEWIEAWTSTVLR